MAFHLFVNLDDSMLMERKCGNRNCQNEGKKASQNRKFEKRHTKRQCVV
jgi:hypothetical protein